MFGTWNATRGFIAFMRLVEVVDVDLEELAVGDRAAAARPACPTDRPSRPSTKGSCTFFSRAVELDVVFDLHARRAIARDEFLTAWFCHGPATSDCPNIDPAQALPL